LEGIRSVFPSTPIIGGSTAGEITPEGPKHRSCVVLALAYEELALGVGAGSGADHDPRLAGHQAAQQAVRHLKARTRSGFIFFGDGLLTGYTEVLRGIQDVLGTSSLVTGGLTGDDLRFTQTYQYADDQVLSRGVAGLLLGGACTIGVGVQHGFQPISKPRRITRARANILSELDGRPASSFYEDYFGSTIMETVQDAGLTRRLIAYPLGIQLDSTGQFLLRNVLSFADDGSMACTGEVSEGSWVQLMIGNKELVIEAAGLAAQDAIRPLRAVHAVLVFDCVARRQLLGQDAGLELARIQDVIGPTVPLIGCYTYGEQTPLGAASMYGRSTVQTGACLIIAIGP
ncbi:MAG: FIST C-terminal domain-containing protein, partial [Candidatus Omnitrophica bacterium]|nr:FIST C-terminal domain-containing protein [Candidatus Omnitrophota bacterium]